MVYASLIKVPKQLLSELEPLTDMVVKHSNTERIRCLVKGLRLMNATVRVSEHDGDDFVYNRASILFEYNAFKVPRFLKNYLLRNFKINKILLQNDKSNRVTYR